jgi:imidazolonepropionase
MVEMVGPERTVVRSPLARRAIDFDARGRVVLPGFVDSHTHALFPAPRLADYEGRIRGMTYRQLGLSGGGIQASAGLLRSMSERRLRRRLRDAVEKFIEHGTTTIEVKSGYGLEADQELKMLRAIASVAAGGSVDLVPTLLFHDVPARYKRARRRFLEAVAGPLMTRVVSGKLAEFCDVFCDRGYFSIAETTWLLSHAARCGLRLKAHADQLSATGAAVSAARMGAVSVDHLDRLAAADVRRLAKCRIVATLLPGSVLHLGSETYPPTRALIDSGVPVALATNFNPGSSPTLNMQMVLALACARMKMSPAEAVTAATINGAYALGRGSSAGSLEVGKQADAAVMDVRDYREIPYYFGMNHCVATVKRGRVLYSRDRS